MSVDVRLLHGFEAIARRGSLSDAARELHLSQPALSLQLKRLEEQTGRALFERQPNRLVLTPFGHHLLSFAARQRELTEAVARAASDFESQPTGALRIGSYTTATSHLLAPIVSAYVRANPAVTVEFDYAPMPVILDKLSGFALDCAVMSEVPARAGLDIVPFFDDRMVLAAGRGIAGDDLETLPFLMYPAFDEPCYQHVAAFLEPIRESLRVAVVCENFESLKQLVIRGAGVSFLPAYMVKRELAAGVLREVPIGDTQLPVTFSFVTKRDATLSAATTLFKEAVLRGTWSAIEDE